MGREAFLNFLMTIFLGSSFDKFVSYNMDLNQKKKPLSDQNISSQKGAIFRQDPFYNLRTFQKWDLEKFSFENFQNAFPPIIYIYLDSTKHQLCFDVKIIAKLSHAHIQTFTEKNISLLYNSHISHSKIFKMLSH